MCSGKQHDSVVSGTLGPLTNGVDYERTVKICIHCNVSIEDPIGKGIYRHVRNDND
jgi:hypothetical protein